MADSTLTHEKGFILDTIMHVFKLKNNRLNNRDINIDQNNRDYDFFHNRAALSGGIPWSLQMPLFI